MKELREFLESDKPTSRALRHMSELFLREGGQVLLVGGAARDIMLQGPNAEPRDLDFVVNGVNLDEVLAPFETRRNGFGALRFTHGGVSIDAWHLRDTWGFKRLGITNPTMADLLKAMFFNIDCLAIELPSQTVYDAGFAAALDDRFLELNFPETLFPGACLVRTSVLSKRYDLRLGPRLEDWVLAQRPRVSSAAIIEGNKSHDPRQVLDTKDLLQPLNDACIAAERRLRAQSRLGQGRAAQSPGLTHSNPTPAAQKPASLPPPSSAAAPQRLAWAPLPSIQDPAQLALPFAPALATFWRRVSSVGRELFDDFDSRVNVAGKMQPELEEALRGPIDIDTIRRVHAVVTRDQAAVPARLVDGSWRHVALAHGQFKERPNELRQRGGNIQEFCPPERVVPELERILAEYQRIPSHFIDVRATWLSAAVVSVHPFIDGNGRVSRVLGDADFLRAGLPVQRASLDTRGSGYIDALVVSFEDLRPLQELLLGEAEIGVGQALRNIEQAAKLDSYAAVLAERQRAELARARFRDDLALLAERERAWVSTIENTVAEAPDDAVRGARSPHGLGSPELADRLALYGLRLRPDCRAVSVRVELGAPGWDCTFDFLPVGALGVGAYWALASSGLRSQRERAPLLLLLSTEEQAAQALRLAKWVRGALVKAAAKSILYDL